MRQLCEIGTVVQIPLQPGGELWELREHVRLDHLDCEQWNEADQRAHPERKARAIRQFKHIVKELLLLVPQPLVAAESRRQRRWTGSAQRTSSRCPRTRGS